MNKYSDTLTQDTNAWQHCDCNTDRTAADLADTGNLSLESTLTQPKLYKCTNVQQYPIGRHVTTDNPILNLTTHLGGLRQGYLLLGCNYVSFALCLLKKLSYCIH